MQAIATRLAGNRQRGEERRLEQHIAGCGGYAGVLTAHDARHRHSTTVVGDLQRIGTQDCLTAIQQPELFARPGLANTDARVEFAEIKAMHRLPQFEHDVVGDVDDWMNRPEPAASQLLCHPNRRYCIGPDTTDDLRGEARTPFRLDQFDRVLIVDFRIDRVEFGHLQPAIRHCGDIPRYAEDTEAIATIWRQVQVECVIGQSKIVAKRLSRRSISR